MPGTEVVPLALFHTLDGTDSRDYLQRVEPSVRGGQKMAQAILDAAFNGSADTSSASAHGSSHGVGKVD